MRKERLTAFSDGVLAIIITIMVLELHVPQGVTLAALRPLLPSLLSYVLSFIYIGIYWNNHHHLFQVTERVNGAILWANMHLLLWLSLVPVATAWVGEHPFAPVPTAVYGVLLLGAGMAYWILQQTIITDQGAGSVLARAVGSDIKGKLSVILYALSIALAWAHPALSDTLFVVVALMWLLPDRRIERVVSDNPGESDAPA